MKKEKYIDNRMNISSTYTFSGINKLTTNEKKYIEKIKIQNNISHEMYLCILIAYII